jgi:hypothetical protein
MIVDEASSDDANNPTNLLWDNQSSVLVGDYLCAQFPIDGEPGSKW